MDKKMSDFTGQYKVSHTLKFELRPVGKTAETLKNSGLLEQDFKRAEDYPKVKTFLDAKHKEFLQKVLEKITDIDWQPLAEQISAFQKNRDLKSDLEKIQKSYRKKIADKFQKDDYYKILAESTPSKLFKQILKYSPETAEEIKTFANFACYFKGYQENRINIYKDDNQQTAAAYRAVNENFTKFFNIVGVFSRFQEHYSDLVDDIVSRTLLLCDGQSISELLQISSYNKFLSQDGIDFLNKIIGEINYTINQYRQQHKEIKSANLPFLPELYKQILSDRNHLFTTNSFSNDAEVYLALRNFIDSNQNVEINGRCVELFSSLRDELSMLTQESDLFVDSKSLEKISSKTTGYWNTIQDAMTAFSENNFNSKKEREKYCKKSAFSLQELKSWNICKPQADGAALQIDISDFWHGEYAAQLFDTEKRLLPELAKLLSEEQVNLRNSNDKVQLIKEYLDTVQEIFHLIKPLAVSEEYGGDLNLLGIITTYCSKLETIIPLYNQVRNYVTKKTADEAKIKLMFNNPTLADGWDKNKEKEHRAHIFRKDDKFYLGIISPGKKIDFDDLETDNASGGAYHKMVYKLLPGPNKMLPKVFFADKNIEFFAPSDELLKRYKHNDHLKGENFDLDFCHSLIDFFKNCITRHKDWVKFDFKFSVTSSYKGIDEFYKEIADQGYSLKFIDIPESAINNLVNDGKLFLFEIWNKDFSEKSTGTPNKSTLYWKELFSPENLADVIFKLNGEAELFMRKQAIRKDTTHQAGEKLVNRTIKNGKAIRQPVADEIYREIYLFSNGKLSASGLSSSTKEHLEKYPVLNWEKGKSIEEAKNRTIVKTAIFDIVKDKRYTEDKFFFHVPITVNFKSNDCKTAKLNEKVLAYLKDNPDVKIIGLDRGERNLIYLTLIDQQGNILKQKSLNVINGVDYHSKLDLREKERNAARKSWQEIGQIKDLKSGYLSGAVYEIAKMMVEKNAIVVMEDLNFGFKRGRMKIEKQIYQKFEKALIDKLNYLVFKNEPDHKAPGGILRGYQLANKLKSFSELGKQCGFIFYVPAGFTSKIDPTTGFVNIFDLKECTTAESVQKFFDRFESIRYSEKLDSFAFEFDYRKFKTHQKDYQNKWVVYSTKEAWRQEKSHTTGKFTAMFYNPTAEIKAAVAKAGVTLKDNLDLLYLLRTIKPENASANFFKSIFNAFRLTVALRHTSGNEDKIISPVMNKNKEAFVSHFEENNPLPQDADANGAFHIALKGSYLLKHCINNGKLEKISNEDWLKFAQTRNK